jgi:hypothetical protein
MTKEVICAKIAVRNIIKDLTDRRGLSQEWDQIEEYLQKEIEDVWVAWVLEAILEMKKS